MTDLVSRLCDGAETALLATFRARALFSRSPWFVYLVRHPSYTGIIVDRTDDPENPIPAHWERLCPVDNAKGDLANLAMVRDALQTYVGEELLAQPAFWVRR